MDAVLEGLEKIMDAQTLIASDEELPMKTRLLALESAAVTLEIHGMIAGRL